MLHFKKSFLSYKLECIIGISTTEKNRITTGEFEIANQLLTHHSLYLAPSLNGNTLSV